MRGDRKERKKVRKERKKERKNARFTCFDLVLEGVLAVYQQLVWSINHNIIFLVLFVLQLNLILFFIDVFGSNFNRGC